MKKYPKYKDSEEEWIGEIAEGWNIPNIKYIGKICSGDFIQSELIQKEGNYPVYNHALICEQPG